MIRIYWLLPKSRRRKCLFKESCSHYVFTLTSNKGLREGLRTLKLRLKQCRPGYYIFKTGDGKEWIILKDKTVIERSVTTV
jgi:uncharacterized protein